MTIPELISSVLNNLRNQFYGPDRVREYKRDERQLIKAIARYGHECNQRGWFFEADFILRDLLQLLLKIRTSGAEIGYLPVYLEGAVDRHIRSRAEELSAKAKTIAPRVASVVRDASAKTVTAVVAPSDVEVLANVFKGIKSIQKSARARRPAKEKQAALL